MLRTPDVQTHRGRRAKYLHELSQPAGTRRGATARNSKVTEPQALTAEQILLAVVSSKGRHLPRLGERAGLVAHVNLGEGLRGGALQHAHLGQRGVHVVETVPLEQGEGCARLVRPREKHTHVTR